MEPKKLDFSKLGFDKYEINDFNIMMSLKTRDQIREWMDAVGYDDVCYGITLVLLAALAVLDEDTEAMTSYPEAMAAIAQIKGQLH